MLVLTRKTNQVIRIGDDITITVVSVGRRSAKIGIDAPREVRVVRGELVKRDERENELPEAFVGQVECTAFTLQLDDSQLRDWFAGQSLAWLAGIELQLGEVPRPCSLWPWVAAEAYKAADAMLAERAKGGES